MRVKVVVAMLTFLATALPAQAKASAFTGIVIAKQPQRGTFVLAAPGGKGLTVHASSRAKVGDRVSVRGVALRDASVRARQMRVIRHVGTARIRGIVVRQLRAATLLATGGSVITIHGPATRRVTAVSHDRELRVGTIAEFHLRFDGDEIEEEAVIRIGQAASIEIEGVLVSVSPLVVSVEGLAVTISVPATATLPSGLAPGQRIELTARAEAGNVFALVAIEEVANVEPARVVEREVRVKGPAMSSTTTELVVASGGATFTFAAPTGVTLPILAVGTIVEVRGVTINGVLTIERLRVRHGSSGPGGSGGHDGGDDDHDGESGHG